MSSHLRHGVVVATVAIMSGSINIDAPSAAGVWQREHAVSDAAARTAAAVADIRVCARAFGSRFQVGHHRFSAPTALADLRCSRSPGNKVVMERASADIGAGRAKGIKTLTRSFRRADGSIHVRAISTVDKAKFSGFGLGIHEFDTLVIRDIRSRVHIWHDETGFHHKANATVASIVLEGQPLQPVDHVIVIPDVARIRLALGSGAHGAHGDTQTMKALRVADRIHGITTVLGLAKARAHAL